MMRKYASLIIAVLLIAGIVSAVPTTGAASGVNSNGFNVSLTGVTGTEAWIEYGGYSGKLNWKTPNVTASGGSASVQVIGSPLYGGQVVVYSGCDSTGCSAERTTTLSAVTPLPTTTFGRALQNITDSRFNPAVIQQSLLTGYTTVTPASVLFGIAFMFVMLGMWMRTRSVRLIAIVGILISPMIMYASAGLYLGAPAVGAAVAQGLLAAGLAGILFSFARR